MPLPSDEKLVELGKEIIDQFHTMFGVHSGRRPAHAKGLLLTGTFTPAPEAKDLTRAPHVSRDSVPVIVRFSDSTGVPNIPDGDPNANPHGIAIRFYLAERVHTDIIAHSADGFPTRTGAEFLEFLRAVAATDPSKPSPTPIEQFLGTHPAALAYVQTPKPSPSSLAREAYFGVTAHRFLDKNGVARHGRYRVTPQAGVEHLDAATAKSKDANYLFDEIQQRVAGGAVRFDIHVQVAGEGDVVDDATFHWPNDRPLVPFGTVTLNGVAPDNDAQQKHIIFDPIARVDGIEPSDDPLLELRAAVYLVSGRARREA